VRNESAALTEARAAAAADATFGADMYQVLAENAADTVFSPASVASALRLALCGARGETAAELACALHLDGSDRLGNAAVSGLSLVSAVRDGSPVRGPGSGSSSGPGSGSATFRAPNTVWVQSGLPLQAEFTARLSQAAATLADADFATAPEAARALINRVIAEQTEGKITGLLPPSAVSRLTRLVLASAVYLKAAWTQPFPESATADAPFYPDGQDRPALTVPMMHLTAPQAYLRGDGYQAVLLPYRDISLAMAVVLPDGPLSALRPKVAAAGLGGLLAGTARHQVTLSLPRFRLEAAFDLIPALQRLGVTEAFGDDADFSGITGAEPLRIGAVAHKAYIDVDEHGTEAAAATAIVMTAMAAFRAPPPVTMVVDRPFLFAIIDTATSLPLFLGQVSHPHAG
jgi:serpin B